MNNLNSGDLIEYQYLHHGRPLPGGRSKLALVLGLASGSVNPYVYEVIAGGKLQKLCLCEQCAVVYSVRAPE